MKKHILYFIAIFYASFVILIRILSNLLETNKVCFTQSSMWQYGPFTLPCFFFDSLYKHLLFPSRILLIITGDFLGDNIYFAISLLLNSILLFFLLKVIVNYMNSKKLQKNIKL